MPEPRKSLSHGKIGEAAVYAKCWMHGIPAYFTGGLRANFAGSDLIVETGELRRKVWIQVKTGAPILSGHVYLTQSAGEEDLSREKFDADFVVFVNLETRIAARHHHAGELSFEHLTFYVLPITAANQLFRIWLKHWHDKPKRDGGRRKLGNMAVHVPVSEIDRYRNAWPLLREQVEG